MKVTNNAPPNSHMIEQATTAGKSKIAGKKAVEHNKSPHTERGTMVDISEQAQLLKKAADLVRETPDIRKDKVEALRQKIESGTYHVDAREIADRLLQEHLATDFGKNNL